MLKDKKKLFIILAIVIVLVVGLVLAMFLLPDEENVNTGGNSEPPKEEVVIPDAPAENTESLIQDLEKVQVTSLDNDVIEFSNEIAVEAGEKVAVWVYSTPKFLGYFDVVIEDGVKKIKGLAEAMKDLKIEAGEHNLAIVTEEGTSIGYIEVYIEENKLFEDEKAAVESKYTTKEVVEKVEVKYQTETKKDANKKSDYREVTQKGVNGEKEITYKVTYDETGKEISREKISEKITKQAVKEIVVVGAADYNINSSKITTQFPGFMCNESQTMEYDGQTVCDDSQMLPSFKAIAIDNGPIMVVTLDGVAITPITITKNGNLYVGTYKGVKYYFEGRGGGISPGGEPLTAEDCQNYNLSCGAW